MVPCCDSSTERLVKGWRAHSLFVKSNTKKKRCVGEKKERKKSKYDAANVNKEIETSVCARICFWCENRALAHSPFDLRARRITLSGYYYPI